VNWKKSCFDKKIYLLEIKSQMIPQPWKSHIAYFKGIIIVIFTSVCRIFVVIFIPFLSHFHIKALLAVKMRTHLCMFLFQVGLIQRIVFKGVIIIQ